MRILVLAPEPFFEPRGALFSLYNHIKALLTIGYEIDLVTYPIGRQVNLPGLTVYRAPAIPLIREVKPGPSLAKIPLDFSLFLTAVWRLCLRRYCELHTHEEASLMGVLLAFIFRCKHLYCMHCDLAQLIASSGFIKNRLILHCLEAVQRFMVRKSDAVIAFYPEIESAAKRMAPGKPVYMILPPAVDEDLPPARQEDVARLREQLQLGDAPVLLYTGTLETYQGLDILLRSAVIVRSKFPAARYVIVGGKAEQVDKLRLFAQELGVTGVVSIVGPRPLEEMPTYMALGDILLSPRSKGNHTPLKLYTYLRSGKPILGTAIYAHTQILTSEIALLVPPTPQDLAEGALELLQNPERAQTLGDNARRVAEEQYSWSAFLEKVQHVYGEFASMAK
jgi:glycosyltransferase involved in cell wall biosynthesis